VMLRSTKTNAAFSRGVALGCTLRATLI